MSEAPRGEGGTEVAQAWREVDAALDEEGCLLDEMRQVLSEGAVKEEAERRVLAELGPRLEAAMARVRAALQRAEALSNSHE